MTSSRFADNIFSGKRLLVVTLVAQCILCIVGFNKIIFEGDTYVLNNKYDALKNYYVYEAYVLQPKEAGYGMLMQTNYPYGESIYYVDNTPLFAVAMRWLHLNVMDLHGLSIPFYHAYMILGLLLSSLFIVLILKRWGIKGLLAFVAALALPWLSSQIWRLPYGHFNLSFSWILLASVYVSQLLVSQVYRYKLSFKFLLLAVSLLVLTLFAGFNHLYYIPIIGMLIGGICGIHFLLNWRKWQRGLLLMATLAVSLGTAVVAILKFIERTDPYYAERSKSLGGFNIQMWNLKLPYLYSAYPDNLFNFIVTDEVSWGMYESFSFLGNGALYALLFLAVMVIARVVTKTNARPILTTSNGGSDVVALALVGIIGVLIAVGEYVELFGVWRENLLNPLVYIKEVFPPVTQFRALGRFSWVSFWAVNLGVVWLISRTPKHYATVMLVAWLIFTAADLSDRISGMNTAYMDNLFSEAHVDTYQQLSAEQGLDEYDAILPVPFIYVGANTDGYTLEPAEEWLQSVFALSVALNKPMMSHKAARSSELQAGMLTAMFRGEAIPEALLDKLKGDRILIYIRNGQEEACACEDAFKQGPAANSLCYLSKIGQTKDGSFYEWRP